MNDDKEKMEAFRKDFVKYRDETAGRDALRELGILALAAIVTALVTYGVSWWWKGLVFLFLVVIMHSNDKGQ